MRFRFYSPNRLDGGFPLGFCHAFTAGGQARPLAPGMVITIEPGLYIARDAVDVLPEYRGIGVRDEDDVTQGQNATNSSGHQQGSSATAET